MQRSSSPEVELYNGGQMTPTAATARTSPPPLAGRMTSTSTVSSASTSFADRAQSPTRLTADAKRYKYLRRILKFRQMDFEYAFWQMLYLLIAPQKVYVSRCVLLFVLPLYNCNLLILLTVHFDCCQSSLYHNCLTEFCRMW